MEEFVQECFEDTLMFYGETINKLLQSKDIFSENAAANITIYLKDIHKLALSLVKDVESGKIGKVHRRVKTWKAKKAKLPVVKNEMPIENVEIVSTEINF